MILTSRASCVALLAALGVTLLAPPGPVSARDGSAPALVESSRDATPVAVALPLTYAPPAADATTTASLKVEDAAALPAPADIGHLLPPVPPAADVALAMPVPVPTEPPVDVAALLAGLPDPALLAAIDAQVERHGWHARLPETDRRQIAAAYAGRGNAPFWIADQGLTPDALKLVETLGRAGDHGLNPRDYAVVAPVATTPEALAEAEIALTAASVLYARDARGGRIEPSRLSALLTPKLALPGAEAVIARLTLAAEPALALEAYQPRHAGYVALKGHLETVRAGRPAMDTQVRIPDGPALRLGMRDERIQLIRARLSLEPAPEPVFDRPLANAVSEFQRQSGLPATGVVSRATLEAMQAPAVARIEADLVANMERWRWLPEELGETHVFVSIPEFRVQFRRDGEIVHDGRAIVGKGESPTPVFSDEIDHLVMNPSWFIPPSIMKNDILPGLARDPDYAAKRGYEVIRRGNNVTVRQPPGERNALGHVKFMFPNRHAVYLHDTPGRHLFARDMRALSHGCVRVEQPLKLAGQILSEGLGPEWTEARLRGMVGHGERMIRLTRKVPVHLTYFTQRVDETGRLVALEDIYGFNRLVRQALGYRG